MHEQFLAPGMFYNDLSIAVLGIGYHWLPLICTLSFCMYHLKTFNSKVQVTSCNMKFVCSPIGTDAAMRLFVYI